LDNLLSGLISSRTRIKLLMRFFLNPMARSYLRELAKEFGVSTNAVREELNQLTRTDLLKVEKKGRSVFYSANVDHALFPELRSMVQKVMGIDQVIDGIVRRLGVINEAYLIGDYADGKDTGVIDIILVGDLNHQHLFDIIKKTERQINRIIRTLLFSQNEKSKLNKLLSSQPHLLIWKSAQ
jgi:predicted DNA-binding protein YlxM (UPF0122 family)